jgi:hypothetical protein
VNPIAEEVRDAPAPAVDARSRRRAIARPFRRGRLADHPEWDFAWVELARPPTIDFTKFKTGEGVEIRDTLGIYRLEGDALALCVGGPGEPRLMTFTCQK